MAPPVFLILLLIMNLTDFVTKSRTQKSVKLSDKYVKEKYDLQMTLCKQWIAKNIDMLYALRCAFSVNIHNANNGSLSTGGIFAESGDEIETDNRRYCTLQTDNKVQQTLCGS